MNNLKTVLIEADTGRTWTRGQLLEHAAALRSPAFKGRLVAFCQPNCAEWFIRFLAIQQSGGAAVPLDSSLSANAQDQTARKIGAHYLWSAAGVQKLTTRRYSVRNVWCVKITSGSMGDIKAVPCSAARMKGDGEQIIRAMDIRPGDRNLALIPLGHSYGLGNLVMPLLLQGTAVVCAQTFVPREILRLIIQHQVTVFPAVPAILRALAQLEGVRKPTSLRLVISAGAPLSADVARQFHRRYGIKIHNFYGSSETGGICYDRTGNAALSGRSVGKPLQGVTVRLRRDGRIRVSSRAGHATLPDLGEWNRYGELRLVGRIAEMANIGGNKVAPMEVESALRGLRGITDAWVTVLKDKHGRDHLAAAVETDRKRTGIERGLMGTLPAWKLPKIWLIAAALPRTNRGKLHTVAIKLRLMASLP